MSVQVRDDNPGRLQFANLRRGFGFDLVRIDAAAGRPQYEAA